MFTLLTILFAAENYSFVRSLEYSPFPAPTTVAAAPAAPSVPPGHETEDNNEQTDG